MLKNNEVVEIANVWYHKPNGLLLSKNARYPKKDWDLLTPDEKHEKRIMAMSAIHKFLST